MSPSAPPGPSALASRTAFRHRDVISPALPLARFERTEAVLRRYATLKAEPALLAVLCGYEFVSIVAGRTPTITNLTMRLGRGARAVVVVVAAGWLAVHLDALPRGSRSVLSDLTGG